MTSSPCRTAGRSTRACPVGVGAGTLAALALRALVAVALTLAGSFALAAQRATEPMPTGRSVKGGGPALRSSGISQRMLTLTLRLERDALITRTVFPTVPTRVEYALTDTGHSLTRLLQAVAAWGEEHGDIVIGSRTAWALSHSS